MNCDPAEVDNLNTIGRLTSRCSEFVPASFRTSFLIEGKNSGRLFNRCALSLILLSLGACGGGSRSGESPVPKQGQSSYREWNWSKVTTFPDFAWPTNVPIPGGDGWNTAVEYNSNKQIEASNTYTREPDSSSIRLFIDSTEPLPAAAISQGHTGSSFRAEIYLAPWHDPIPLKTEYWLGWSYYFPSTYVSDPTSDMSLFQGHVGQNGPPVGIYINSASLNVFLHASHGIYGDSTGYRAFDTGVQLQAGYWYDFVMHIIWDTESGGSGLTELWIDGAKCRIVGGNVFDSDSSDPNVPYAGTPKLGLYKWPWEEPARLAASQRAGVNQLEVYLGPVRFLKNSGDYLDPAGYDSVAPKGTKSGVQVVKLPE